MILDRLSNARTYEKLHPLLAPAFAYLDGLTLQNLPEGKHRIEGESLYTVPFRCEGLAREAAPLEAHRRFVDIHYLLDGKEEIGWKPGEACLSPQAPFDEANDFVLFKDEPQLWIPLRPGDFLLVWPGEAHAPRVGAGILTKLVVKLLV